jgi:hypothetical protein
MNLRRAVDALLFERARVVAEIEPSALHAAIEIIAPFGAQLRRGRSRRRLPAMLLGLAPVA